MRRYLPPILLQCYSKRFGATANLMKNFIDLIPFCSFQLLKSSELQHNITDVPQAWILLELADMLGLQQAAAICDQYICQHINVENAEKHYLYASKFSRSAVTNEIIREVALSK